jgi:hypothetical protein
MDRRVGRLSISRRVVAENHFQIRIRCLITYDLKPHLCLSMSMTFLLCVERGACSGTHDHPWPDADT